MRRRRKTAPFLSNICPVCKAPFLLATSAGRALYDWYIEHSHVWKAIRQWALSRSSGRCEQCGATYNLHVHHKTYARLGHEHPEDVMVLCEVCHEREHERIRLQS